MSLKKVAVSGVKWSSIAFTVRRVLAFLTSIILARLLSPSDFGLIAMASLALGFIELFKDLGTASAVIQRKQISEELLSSVFWINAGFGLIVSSGLYLLSPYVADFYHEPQVTPLIEVLSLSFFVSALSIVQSSLLTRAMAFEKLAKYELVTAVFSSCVAIGAAWCGFGVMSLVYQPLLNSILLLILLWSNSSWRPKWIFQWVEISQIANYSLNLTGFNIINYFARNADNLLIGRYLGAVDLGYYDLAYRMMIYPLQGISAVVAKVMFPLYSQMQDDNERFRSAYLKSVGAIALFSFPLMLGLFSVSQHFVLALFGEKWLPVVALLMIFSPLGALQSITTTVGSIYQAKGRTDWLLRWGLFSSIFVMLAFVVGLRWGILGVASAYTGAYLVMATPFFMIPFRLIELRLRDLAKVLWRPLLCSILMSVMVMAIDILLPVVWPHWVALSLLVALGAFGYILMAWLINRKVFSEIVSLMAGKA